jgi:hypothetical protein
MVQYVPGIRPNLKLHPVLGHTSNVLPKEAATLNTPGPYTWFLTAASWRAFEQFLMLPCLPNCNLDQSPLIPTPVE